MGERVAWGEGIVAGFWLLVFGSWLLVFPSRLSWLAAHYVPARLYIASAGIREPLIVSQVVRYLRSLRDSIETCHLITFERDAMDASSISEEREALQSDNIHWHSVRAYRRFRAANIWRESWNGYQLAKRLVREYSLNVVHARSFLPGNIGLKLRSM